MMANLDNEIMDVLKNIIKDEGGSNKSLNDSMWLESRNMEDVRNGELKKSSDDDIRRLIEDMDPTELDDIGMMSIEDLYEEPPSMTESFNGQQTMPTISYVDHMDNRPMRG
jgi:hypothetical protein